MTIDDYEPAGDFAGLLEAVSKKNVPQEQIDAAAAVITKAIEDQKSASEIIAIATQVIGGLVRFI